MSELQLEEITLSIKQIGLILDEYEEKNDTGFEHVSSKEVFDTLDREKNLVDIDVVIQRKSDSKLFESTYTSTWDGGKYWKREDVKGDIVWSGVLEKEEINLSDEIKHVLDKSEIFRMAEDHFDGNDIKEMKQELTEQLLKALNL